MRLIRTTFEIVTPESAEHGDVESRGWIDEEGYAIEPDDDESAVDLAMKFLGHGFGGGIPGLEPSSYPTWSQGTWYTDCEYSTNYRTGAVESRSYHLDGFTEDEEREIYARIK